MQEVLWPLAVSAWHTQNSIPLPRAVTVGSREGGRKLSIRTVMHISTLILLLELVSDDLHSYHQGLDKAQVQYNC